MKPRFPIASWNLNHRILENKPATNNPIEVWHSSLTADTKSHATLNVVLEELQLEQSNTETHIIKLDSGEVYKTTSKKARKEKKLKIYNCVLNYKSFPSIMGFLQSMSLNLGDADIKIL